MIHPGKTLSKMNVASNTSNNKSEDEIQNVVELKTLKELTQIKQKETISSTIVTEILQQEKAPMLDMCSSSIANETLSPLSNHSVSSHEGNINIDNTLKENILEDSNMSHILNRSMESESDFSF